MGTIRRMSDSKPSASHEDVALEQRVQELEVRAAFGEKVVDDLDAVVRDFTERVSRLERELRELRAQLVTFGGSASPEPDLD